MIRDLTWISIVKTLTALAAIMYFVNYLATPEQQHFIDFINILMHEAGHWIFAVFGHLMGVLGGSINQVLIPLIFAGNFFFRGENFSGSIMLFWVGQNFINVSQYAGDAVKMQLPLLGGGNGWETGSHDWNYLLIYWGVLPHTDAIATTLKISGIIIIIIAIFLSLLFAWERKEKISYDPNTSV